LCAEFFGYSEVDFCVCMRSTCAKMLPLLHFKSPVSLKTFLAVVLLAALGVLVSFVSCSYIKIS